VRLASCHWLPSALAQRMVPAPALILESSQPIQIQTVSSDNGAPADTYDQILLPWSKNFVWGWTHILNPGLFSDLRFDYATRSWGGHQSSAGLDYPQKLRIPLPNNIPPKTQKFNDDNNHFPTISAGQYTMPSGAWLGSGDYQLPMRNFHAVESLTWVKSSHTFKFGYETRRSTVNFYSDLNSSGTYNFLARGTALNPSDATSGM